MAEQKFRSASGWASTRCTSRCWLMCSRSTSMHSHTTLPSTGGAAVVKVTLPAATALAAHPCMRDGTHEHPQCFTTCLMHMHKRSGLT